MLPVLRSTCNFVKYGNLNSALKLRFMIPTHHCTTSRTAASAQSSQEYISGVQADRKRQDSILHTGMLGTQNVDTYRVSLLQWRLPYRLIRVLLYVQSMHHARSDYMYERDMVSRVPPSAAPQPAPLQHGPI